MALYSAVVVGVGYYSYKSKSFEDRADDLTFFLEEDDSGNLYLQESHPYYYQVQLQMKLYDAHYCDFVVWRESEMFIQRISCNVTFITEALDKIPRFIKLCILPELVGKWFTRPAEPSTDSSNEVVAEVVHDSLDGPSNMTLHTTEDGTSDMTLCTTEVDDTVSVTATSDIPTNTQDSLQGLDEDSS